jgi:hypothetical protein
MRKAIKILGVTAMLAAAAAYRTMISYADEVEFMGMSQRIPVKQVLKGDRYKEDYRVTLTLTAESADNPMPPGSIGMTKTISAPGRGEPDFGPILFIEPGAYYYTITRKGEADGGPEIDGTIYRVMIAMLSSGDSEMIIWDDKGAKVEKIIYTDYYRKPSDPGTSKGDPPKTGDEINLQIAVDLSAVCIAAAAALIHALRVRRRM